MFYIISSRIPLISHDNTNRKYFKLFVMGSAIYVCIHYYLHKQLHSGMLEKIKKFIYHVMVVDFIIASILLKYLKISNPEEENDKENENVVGKTNIQNSQTNQTRLTAELEEQRRLFLQQHQQRMLEQRMLEENRQKLLEQQRQLEEKQKNTKVIEDNKKSKKDDKQNVSDKSSDNKKQKKEKSNESSKKSSTSSSTSSSAESSSKKSEKSIKKEEKNKEIKKVKQVNKEENVTESELPLYE